jgi:hypothetical protein
MIEVLQSLPPLVTLVLGLLLVVWLVLFLLVPFMLESIRSWTRRTYHELAEMNRKLDEISRLLERGSAPPPAVLYDVPEQRVDTRARDVRVRKEPTI